MHKVIITVDEISKAISTNELRRATLIGEILDAVMEISDTKMLQTVCQDEGYTYFLKTVFKDLHLGFGKLPQPGIRALCELVRIECESKNVIELVVEVPLGSGDNEMKKGTHFSMHRLSATEVVFFVSKH